MGLWEKLTKTEKHCYYFLGNGFKQCEIAILKAVQEGVIRTHIHSGKNKAESVHSLDALEKFRAEGAIEVMPAEEKEKCRKYIDEYRKKYPKEKQEKPQT